MLTLAIDEAREGMRLAATVPHPAHPDQDLLTAGYVLDAGVIRKMREMGITFLYVDYPALSDLDQALLPHLSPARKKLYGQIKRSIESVQRHARPQASYATYYGLTRQFVLTMLKQGKQPYYLDELSTRLGDGAVGHATTVAHLSLMLGIGLEAYIVLQRRRLHYEHAKEILNLGAAGMLHDLGKAALPAHLQQYHALRPPESEADMRLWETHPQVGYDMVHSDIEPSAAAAIRLHHAHFDGGGFPRLESDTPSHNLYEGSHIHVYGRILFAADLYDRLSFGDDGRRRCSLEVLHLMRTRFEHQLDPQITAALPRVIPPFPPGVKVRLSDGSAAVVLALSPRRPYRPTVRRFAADGWALEERVVDLGEETDLRITIAAGVAVEDFVPEPTSPPVTA